MWRKEKKIVPDFLISIKRYTFAFAFEERLIVVSKNQHFNLPFGAYKIGNHTFHFEVEEDFFTEREQSLIQGGSLKVKLEMEKGNDILVLNFGFEGMVRLLCDRCYDEFEKPLSGKERHIVKLVDDTDGLPEDTDEVVFLPKTETAMNVADLIYEALALALPMVNTHPDDKHGTPTCDPTILARLTKEEDMPTNPIWDALKGLNN